MRVVNGEYRFSPSDLITYLECPYVSWLDRFALDFPGQLVRDPDSEEDQLLQAAGQKHEQVYLQRLQTSSDVFDLKNDRTLEATRAAMKSGHRVIYQATLQDGEFAGIADFLMRVPGESALGEYLYEVWDTKLARTAKPYHAIQVCCYAEMLEKIQGVQAQHAGIILGSGEKHELALADYKYYYRALKATFLDLHHNFNPDAPIDLPVRGDFRHWTSHVERIREERDDLTQVAGIRSTQIRRLEAVAITTATALAESRLDDVRGVGQSTFHRLRQQAELQKLSKDEPRPFYRVIPRDPEQPRLGFGALPPASSNDIYFDMEGYPLVDGGLEYLFGASYIEGGQQKFADWWAHDRGQEKKAFEEFVFWAHARWKQDPTMHIYHYANYEKAALLRLAGRNATCEDQLDDLLRNEVLVDLYRIVRQAVIIGEPSYSLKSIEKLYLAPRTGEVATASASIVYYQRWIDHPDGESWKTSQTLKLIRDYNQEDCDSTLSLAVWLRDRQSSANHPYAGHIADVPLAASEQVSARAQFASAMAEEAVRIEDAEQRRTHLLLSQLLEFHRREQRPVWREYFERLDMSEHDLIDDPECLGGLVLTDRPERDKNSYRYKYHFESQETKLRENKKCAIAGHPSIKIEIESIDFDGGFVTFRRSVKQPAPPARISLIPYEIVSQNLLSDAIQRAASDYRNTGRLKPALADFVGRKSPRLWGIPLSDLAEKAGSAVDLAIEASQRMDETSMILQGPPGTGKTRTASKMIAALLCEGKRVGVTSNSHRAISLLLGQAVEACRAGNVRCQGVIVDPDDEVEIACVSRVDSASGLASLPFLPNLVGGTAWVFCRPEMTQTFDYLFIDEAGQVSLANLVAVSGCARNLIILGDQCQLNQPMQGTHPGESGASILEYYLRRQPTIDLAQGIFLEKTWRMGAELCSFLSAAIYQDRLQPAPVTSNRRILQTGRQQRQLRRTEGLLYVPVVHDGSAYECPVEAQKVAEIVDELLGARYQDESGPARRLMTSDILVVSPYNLQVLLLQKTLRAGIRVGTVDKFQGQEAPVVIYSMATSNGDACPRGIDFLFSPNRFNVALSRAKVLAIVVASTQLIRTSCRSLDQMKLVNLYCRAVEAGVVHLAAAGAGSQLAS